MIYIYEVMAVENKVPLFFLEHILRFKESISMYKNYSKDELIKEVLPLIKSLLTGNSGYNIKIKFSVEKSLFTAERSLSRRPSLEEYKLGAKVDLFKGERKNPLIKSENLELRISTELFCKDNDLYDVLLVDRNLNITEGSRTNFFIITSEGAIISPPRKSALKGITKGIVLDICSEIGIEIKEQPITKKSIENAKSLFLTGTSPEILPIIKCGEIIFSMDSPIIPILIDNFRNKKEMDYTRTKEIFLNAQKTRQ